MLYVEFIKDVGTRFPMGTRRLLPRGTLQHMAENLGIENRDFTTFVKILAMGEEATAMAKAGS